MNKYLKRFLWIFPLAVGVMVFLFSGIYYLNAMKRFAGDGNYNPIDAFLLALHPAAIFTLGGFQISIVIGFCWWIFSLGRSTFGKNARQSRAARKIQQKDMIEKESNVL